MGFAINTNIQALNAQRNLNLTNVKMGKALEKLSSGLRINRAADDAAGLAISEKLRAQVRGMGQASRNAGDAISMLQTAEGALGEVAGILQRMRELALQAGNSTLSTEDRTAIGEEVIQLRDEIDRIATSVTFNGQSLLTGALTTTLDVSSVLQVGDNLAANNSSDQVVSTIDVSKADAATNFVITNTAEVVTLTVGTTSQDIDLDLVAGINAAGEKVLDFSTFGIKVTLVGGAVAVADRATLAASLTGQTDIITAAGDGSAVFHVGANQNETITVNFTDMQAAAIGDGTDLDTRVGAVAATVVDTTTKANDLLGTVDAAIVDVSSQRATFGASQNRVEITVNSLAISIENLSASESRVRDADIASVSSELVTRQILQQAGVSVLAQANQSAQAALALLQ